VKNDPVIENTKLPDALQKGSGRGTHQELQIIRQMTYRNGNHRDNEKEGVLGPGEKRTSYLQPVEGGQKWRKIDRSSHVRGTTLPSSGKEMAEDDDNVNVE